MENNKINKNLTGDEFLWVTHIFMKRKCGIQD